jgi:outer membrane protein TolC
VYDFGQRRAAIDESKENVLAQQDMIKDIDRQTRSSIATTYNTILNDAQTAATWTSTYVKDDRAAALARAQADAGVGDELTWVQDQLTALTDKSELQATQLSERLQYAALQNLAAGTWHWLP